MTTKAIARGGSWRGNTGDANGDKRCGLSDEYDSTNRKVSQADLRATNGRVVARVCGDVLKNTVSGSRHFLREPVQLAFSFGA